MIPNSNFLHLITDYGVGDPAFGEVIQKLKLLKPDLEIHPTSVPAFSTLATGFWIGQYALVNSWLNLTIFSNTAPRDLPGFRKHNGGEPFVYALLDNGVRIAAVNAGYCLSFVKNHIVHLHQFQVHNHGSQFRSRDFYPEAVVKLIQLHQPPRLKIQKPRGLAINSAHRHPEWSEGSSPCAKFYQPPRLIKEPRGLIGDQLLGPALDPSSISDVPKNRIAFIDGYGNIKTTTRHSEVTQAQPPRLRIQKPRGLYLPGQQLHLIINGVLKKATYTAGIFEVPTGELAFAPGSSGGGEDPFMEIIYRTNIHRGGSAAESFNYPKVESQIQVTN